QKKCSSQLKTMSVENSISVGNNKFHTASANIHYQNFLFSKRHCLSHSVINQFCFLQSVYQLNFYTGLALCFQNKIISILGFAKCGCSISNNFIRTNFVNYLRKFFQCFYPTFECFISYDVTCNATLPKFYC